MHILLLQFYGPIILPLKLKSDAEKKSGRHEFSQNLIQLSYSYIHYILSVPAVEKWKIIGIWNQSIYVLTTISLANHYHNISGKGFIKTDC